MDTAYAVHTRPRARRRPWPGPSLGRGGETVRYTDNNERTRQAHREGAERTTPAPPDRHLTGSEGEGAVQGQRARNGGSFAFGRHVLLNHLSDPQND